MRRIGLDLDGCLADFNSAYARLLTTTTDRHLLPWDPFTTPAPLDAILTWDWERHYGYTEPEIAKVWDHINNDVEFWQKLNPLAGCGALQKCPHLYRNNEVYFITARTGYYPKWQTENWLIEHLALDFCPTVLISKEKGLAARALRLDLYIDDRWENCFDVANLYPPCRTYLLDAPYNRSNVPLSVIRVPSVEHMLTTEGFLT